MPVFVANWVSRIDAPEQRVVWTRRDVPGHEACHVQAVETGWRLQGTAVLAHDGFPCRLDYVIECDPRWATRSVGVTGWVGNQSIDVRIARDADSRWRVNGRVCEGVAGCVDVDLGFSPSTNLLPIRRLEIGVGASASVRAALLAFPSFALEPLDQTYTRLERGRYRYQACGGFEAEVTVDRMGLVVDYGKIWSREAPPGAAVFFEGG